VGATFSVVLSSHTMVKPIRTLLFTLVSWLVETVTALPSSSISPFRNRDVATLTVMSATQLAALAPYTQFARAAYCSPNIVQGWKCGGMLI